MNQPVISPVLLLFRSRKFVLGFSYGVGAIIAIVASWFLPPEKVKDIKDIIVIMLPIVVSIILAIAYEDAATIKAVGMMPSDNLTEKDIQELK